MTAVSVVVPTHDHGPTLNVTLELALAQSLEDIEVLVIGDGCTDLTREIMAGFCARDPRVRFFDLPKGPRLGESHRNQVIGASRGDVVAYLCDDDLWHPCHLESLVALLDDADFAHTLPVAMNPDGSLHTWSVDLAQESDRRLLLEVENRVPLCFVGHTADFFRRLPNGWETTPPGIPTDLHFYRQCLAFPGVRAVSGMLPTGLHLPSPDRREVPVEERVHELAVAAERIANDWGGVVSGCLAAVAADRADLEGRYRDETAQLRRELSEMAQFVENARAHAQRMEASAESYLSSLGHEKIRTEGLVREVEAVAARLDAAAVSRDEALAELSVIRSTVTWRLHDRLLPAVRALRRRPRG